MRFPRYGRKIIAPSSFGGHSEGETPGSIPNPEVKPFSADGTARETVWESRTPPNILSQLAAPNGGGLLCVHALSIHALSIHAVMAVGTVTDGAVTAAMRSRRWDRRKSRDAVVSGHAAADPGRALERPDGVRRVPARGRHVAAAAEVRSPVDPAVQVLLAVARVIAADRRLIAHASRLVTVGPTIVNPSTPVPPFPRRSPGASSTPQPGVSSRASEARPTWSHAISSLPGSCSTPIRSSLPTTRWRPAHVARGLPPSEKRPAKPHMPPGDTIRHSPSCAQRSGYPARSRCCR